MMDKDLLSLGLWAGFFFLRSKALSWNVGSYGSSRSFFVLLSSILLRKEVVEPQEKCSKAEPRNKRSFIP